MNDVSCVFCKIVSGEIPSAKIYENEIVSAFLDIKPVNPGHALVVPKKHYANLYELPDEILAPFMRAARDIARALKKELGADGVNIEMNNDRPAGQIVSHAHLHVIPRKTDDGLRHWPGKEASEGEMKRIADTLAKSLI